jgi:hypothetical protein
MSRWEALLGNFVGAIVAVALTNRLTFNRFNKERFGGCGAELMD